jgi:PKD repeat protein
MRAGVLFLTALLLLTALSAPVYGANTPPVANAGEDQQVKVGTMVRFGAGSSYDPDGDHLAYKWDFDSSDGITVESSMIAPTNTYTKAGIYIVTLTVTDGKDNSSDTMQVKVIPETTPMVELGPDINAEVNQWVFFDTRNATDQDGDSLTFKWDFDASNGIGVDSTDRLPQWKFTKPGKFTVTLIASDGKYNATDTLNVTVSYNFLLVGGKGQDDAKSLRSGQKMVYSISLIKGKGLNVKITSTNGTLLTTYLFESKNYFTYTQNGQIVALSKASKINFTKHSYSIGAPITDDYYLVVLNPSADPTVVASYDISIKIGGSSGGGFIPGPGAFETMVTVIIVALAIALARKRP